MRIDSRFTPESKAVLFPGDCLKLLRSIPDQSIQLIVTSPPYNIGKEYEDRLDLLDYIAQQSEVIRECVRVMKMTGSICWQVGNYVNKGSVLPCVSMCSLLRCNFNVRIMI